MDSNRVIKRIMKDEEQQQKETLIQPQTVKTKKALIVVGKAGHGKSSFVRMLTQKRNDQAQFSENSPKSVDQGNLQKPIIIGCGAKNGTDSCNLFKVDPSHQLLPNGEDLYVIDTPGIDFNASIFLMMEQIDEIICKNHCEIVGIAYVINISERQQIKSGESDSKQVSFVGEVMRLLKLKMKFKKNLIFHILSKWDDHCFKKETSKTNFQIYKKMAQLQMKGSSFKFVKWVSKPSLDFQTYLDFFESKRHQGRKFIDEQWKQLKEIISSQLSNTCSFQQYQKNLYQYISKIFEVFKTKQYGEKEIRKSNFPIIATDKKISIWDYLKTSTLAYTPSAVSFAATQIGSRYGMTLGLAYLGLQAVVPPVLIATLTLGATYCLLSYISKNWNTKQISLNKSKEEIVRQKTEFRLHSLYQKYILNYLSENSRVQKSTLIIPNKNWFKSIKVFQVFGNKNTKNAGSADKIEKDKQIKIKLSIKESKGPTEEGLLFLLHCQTEYPKAVSLDADVRQIIHKVYNEEL